ncbi:MAG: hypothetical protein QXF26_03275, partial [Candidatus Bathyarchaeia archaeon]
MFDPLLTLSTFFCILMVESRKVALARFSLAFFGLFLSLHIILYGAGLAGLLLLFNLSFFSTSLLAV